MRSLGLWLRLSSLAQLAKVTALTQALDLAEGIWVTIYTDSKYAF